LKSKSLTHVYQQQQQQKKQKKKDPWVMSSSRFLVLHVLVLCREGWDTTRRWL